MNSPTNNNNMESDDFNESTIFDVDWNDIREKFSAQALGSERYLGYLIKIWKYHTYYRNQPNRKFLTKINALVKGRSGCGKTYMLKVFFSLLNIPYIVFPCAGVTSSGYYGKNLSDCLEELVELCKGDIKLAEKGVIILDEMDKMMSKDNDRIKFGTDTQNEMLKLLDGEVMSINDGVKAQMQNISKELIDTSKILFIAVGAFGAENVNLTKLNILERHRMQSNNIDEIYQNYVRFEAYRNAYDFVHANMIDELRGRFNYSLIMEYPSPDSLRKIIFSDTYEYSIASQLNKYLGCSIEYTEALKEYILTRILTDQMGIRIGINCLMQFFMSNDLQLNEKIILDYQNNKMCLITQ